MYTVKIEIPYDSNLSKNKRHIGGKLKFKNKEHQKIQNDITKLFLNEIKDKPKPIKGIVEINFCWFRASLVGDASNFINPINDSIRNGLDFDDNLFRGSYDWKIDKNNPRFEIYVTIYDHEFC